MEEFHELLIQRIYQHESVLFNRQYNLTEFEYAIIAASYNESKFLLHELENIINKVSDDE
jgi:hypothetical protein